MDELLTVVDDGLTPTIPRSRRCTVCKIDPLYVVVGLLAFSTVVNVVLFVELNIVVAELAKMQETLPDVIDNYIEALMERVGVMVGSQVDDVVERTATRMSGDLSRVFLTDITSVVIPTLKEAIVSDIITAFTKEFGNINMVMLMDHLQKLIAYACVMYPGVCEPPVLYHVNIIGSFNNTIM